ncbi:MAG: hypothetical protein H0T53_03460 [Herpetosiphonaceae bacterium]|nr:hypothetical protein [Herpetosiphonaceae bacterium]
MFNPPPGIDREQYQTSRQALTWFMVIVSLLLIGALSGVIALGVLAHLFGIGNVIFNLTICLIAIPVCAACIVGVVTLMPVARRPVDFAPRLSVPSTVEGQPFDVRLQPKGMVGDSFTGEGVVQFLPDHMTIDGMRNSFLIQSSILVAVMVVTQQLVEIQGIGVIPAIILSSYLGRTKIVQTIPYHAIRTIILDGNTITLACPSLSPNTFIFYVASVDGSRLHGEIQPRFAALLLASQ